MCLIMLEGIGLLLFCFKVSSEVVDVTIKGRVKRPAMNDVSVEIRKASSSSIDA